MNLKEALTTRRSARRFTGKPVPETTIQEILSYAPWVPNHHVSEPWRFVLVTGESLQELAQLRYDAVLDKRRGQSEATSRAERAQQEFLEASWVIVAIQRLDPEPVRREEDYAAVVMATYNIILAAWSLGVGSFWNTGPLMNAQGVHTWLQLTDDERPVAFLRLGYPDTMGVSRRSDISTRLVWRH